MSAQEIKTSWPPYILVLTSIIALISSFLPWVWITRLNYPARSYLEGIISFLDFFWGRRSLLWGIMVLELSGLVFLLAGVVVLVLAILNYLKISEREQLNQTRSLVLVALILLSLSDLPLLFITFLMLIPLDPFGPSNYPYLGFFSLQASLILLFCVYIYFRENNSTKNVELRLDGSDLK
ncbi:MAG: hypothetical protein ACFFCZ_16880 [Promethearchaeota archaeon]